jgi:long-chain acyl-CoA synthetase
MDFRRLFEIFPFQQSRYPQKVALAHRQGGESWETFSTEECLRYINRVSAGLLNLGLNRGDKVAILSIGGSAYWNFLDFGMQQIGLITVPIHAITPLEELIYILNDCEARACFVSDGNIYAMLEAVREKIPLLERIYSIREEEDLPHWEEILSEPLARHLEKIQSFRAAIHEDDLATIIYTSGVTGAPKGVMLSHKNMVSNIKAIITMVPVNCDKRTISFLPLSHVFERMVVFTYIAVGASVYYAEAHQEMEPPLREVKPHYFTAVPRMIERFYELVREREKGMHPLFRRIHRWAIRLGQRYNETRRLALWYFIKLQIADLLVYQQWRRAMGGRIDGIVVGAAALKPQLGRLFSAAGIDIREGYGLTETAPVIAFNRFEPGGVRFGTVGMPIPGIELKIEALPGVEEGEIWVKGPNVMLGYYNHPDLTAQAFTEDGWFRTGDVGRFVHQHFLEVTGRKRHMIKTSSGKFISLQQLEAHLRDSSYIEQCMTIGLNRPFVSAIILPDFYFLEQWCRKNRIHWTAPPYMVHNHKVKQFYSQLIEQLNESLQSFEKIRAFRLTHEDWTVNNGMYTATLKLRRNVIYEKYRKEIEGMYA